MREVDTSRKIDLAIDDVIGALRQHLAVCPHTGMPALERYEEYISRENWNDGQGAADIEVALEDQIIGLRSSDPLRALTHAASLLCSAIAARRSDPSNALALLQAARTVLDDTPVPAEHLG